MEIDDETLMALADGEITGADAARLHARIAEDADLAARYALFTRTAELVKLAALEGPDATVSADFEARIRAMAADLAPPAEKVIPLRRNAPRWQPMALAASLALAVGLSAGLLLAPGARQPAAALSADLRGKLDTLPAGAQDRLADGSGVSIIASFTDGAGAFCREYETSAAEGAAFVNIACRSGDAWGLRFVMATSAAGEGYTPASALAALDAFYASTGASQPMSLDAEQPFLK